VSSDLINGTTAFYSFDYYAETITWSWVVAVGAASRVTPPTQAKFGSMYNVRGAPRWTVFVPGPNNSVVGSQSQTITFNTLPLYITNSSEETRGNLVYYTTTVEALYQE
jgi:hypothetical protein